jgi:uncharacterized protein VirK/YbjX
MALYELRSLAARPARIFDGVVLTTVTLAALIYCYNVKVFPSDSRPHTLELDEIFFVTTIFCGGLFICALRCLAEQRRAVRIAPERASGAKQELSPPFPNARGSSASAPKAFLGDIIFLLYNVTREERYWNIRRFTQAIGRLYPLLSNLPDQVEILRFLSTFKGLASKQPMFPVKYLRGHYLVLGLKPKFRAAAFAHHYRFMQRNLSEDLLHEILFDEVLVWRRNVEDNNYQITLTFSHPINHEGEFSLYFGVNGARVFVLSFTVVPGHVVEVPAENAILLTRVQGVKGHFSQIRLATKALCQVAPPAALVAALQGIGSALNIRTLAGVCSAHNVCYGNTTRGNLETVYDEFFAALGTTKSPSGIFSHGTIPLPEKPMNSIKVGHRLRTKAKRALKKQISECVTEKLRCENEASAESRRYEARRASEARLMGSTAKRS